MQPIKCFKEQRTLPNILGYELSLEDTTSWADLNTENAAPNSCYISLYNQTSFHMQVPVEIYCIPSHAYWGKELRTVEISIHTFGVPKDHTPLCDSYS